MKKRCFILSLDGLNNAQFDQLLTKAPALRLLIEKAPHRHHLQSEPLTTATAIWSEIYSGQPWHKTGIAGWTKPTDSLNEKAINSEADFPHSPWAGNKQNIVSINMPLLLPTGMGSWLSDGSLQLTELVAPASLRARDPFNTYQARPFVNLCAESGDRQNAAQNILQTETTRTRCAVQLAQNPGWDLFLWRVSAFDQLQHLFGPNFLRSHDLRASPDIDNFCQTLDGALSSIQSQFNSCTICVLSAYDLITCKSLCNLNQHLQRLGLCQMLEADAVAASSTFNQRAAIVAKLRPQAAPLVNSRLLPTYSLPQTLAASPHHAAIYINKKSQFIDGSVPDLRIEEITNTIETAFYQSLSTQLPDLKLIKKPAASAPQAPDFLVSAPGTEFVSVQQPGAQETPPLWTHGSSGFAYLPFAPDSSQPLTAHQFGKVLRQEVITSDA